MFDILLKSGLIIDPSQAIHGEGSVAIQDGKIRAVGKNLPDGEATKIFDMRGKMIVPGLIDVHCHPVKGFWELGVPADEFGLNSGVTLLGDAGSAGPANFEALRLFIVERARTDILCFLNLSNTGLVKIPELCSERDFDVDRCKQTVEVHADIIRGIKVRCVQALAEGPGMKAIEGAKKLASDCRMPLMLHIGETRKRVPADKMDDFSRAAVALLEKGDILSHYLTWEPGGMILKDGTVYPELSAAHKRGVFVDSCHGLNHFSFTIARHALSVGLIPSIISTDMVSIVRSAAQSLTVVMSKFMNLGLTVEQVIEMTTINPARALREEGRRGSLKPGMAADITVLELTKGDYCFADGTGGERMQGDRLLEPRMVFKGGEPMPAYSGYHIPPVYKTVS
jgi:dihydroorotase